LLLCLKAIKNVEVLSSRVLGNPNIVGNLASPSLLSNSLWRFKRRRQRLRPGRPRPSANRFRFQVALKSGSRSANQKTRN